MNSIKLILTSACLALVLFSCSKSDNTTSVCATQTTTATATEVDTLRSYLSSNGITASSDPRGFFYTIIRTGDTSRRPTICSSVKITYTGRYTNGVQFDAGSNVDFVLRNLILGWQEAIPLLGKGGSIALYVPPSLAYGSTGSGKIPGYTYLVFYIDLVDIY